MKTVRMVITGRVQGVFFRVFTQKRAEELDLVGYVRNLPDYSVEIVVMGPQDKLSAMESWAHEGSPFARVDSVTVESVPEQRFTLFSIR